MDGNEAMNHEAKNSKTCRLAYHVKRYPRN